MTFVISSKTKANDSIDVNRSALKKYLTECEKNEFEAYENQIALAECLNSCRKEWYETPTFIISGSVTLLLTGLFIGLNSK